MMYIVCFRVFIIYNVTHKVDLLVSQAALHYWVTIRYAIEVMAQENTDKGNGYVVVQFVQARKKCEIMIMDCKIKLSSLTRTVGQSNLLLLTYTAHSGCGSLTKSLSQSSMPSCWTSIVDLTYWCWCLSCSTAINHWLLTFPWCHLSFMNTSMNVIGTLLVNTLGTRIIIL